MAGGRGNTTLIILWKASTNEWRIRGEGEGDIYRRPENSDREKRGEGKGREKGRKGLMHFLLRTCHISGTRDGGRSWGGRRDRGRRDGRSSHDSKTFFNNPWPLLRHFSSGSGSERAGGWRGQPLSDVDSGGKKTRRRSGSQSSQCFYCSVRMRLLQQTPWQTSWSTNETFIILSLPFKGGTIWHVSLQMLLITNCFILRTAGTDLVLVLLLSPAFFLQQTSRYIHIFNAYSKQISIKLSKRNANSCVFLSIRLWVIPGTPRSYHGCRAFEAVPVYWGSKI